MYNVQCTMCNVHCTLTSEFKKINKYQKKFIILIQRRIQQEFTRGEPTQKLLYIFRSFPNTINTQFIYFVCLSSSLFVSNKLQNYWTDRAQILCMISHDPKESLWMIKISKISLQQNLIFVKFWNPRFFHKIRELFYLLV